MMERTVSFILTVLISVFVASALLSLPYNRMASKRAYQDALDLASIVKGEVEALDRLVGQDPNRVVNYTLNLPLTIQGSHYTIKLTQHYIHVTLENSLTVNLSLNLRHVSVRPCSFNGGTIHLYYRGGVLYAYNVKG